MGGSYVVCLCYREGRFSNCDVRLLLVQFPPRVSLILTTGTGFTHNKYDNFKMNGNY